MILFNIGLELFEQRTYLVLVGNDGILSARMRRTGRGRQRGRQRRRREIGVVGAAVTVAVDAVKVLCDGWCGTTASATSHFFFF